MRGGAVGPYLVAALLARTADSGAVVGVATLALDPGTGLNASATTAGVLAACLTVPHLLGLWLARWLDRARDTRGILIAASAGFGAAVGIGGVLLEHRAVVPAAVAFVAAGACGPMLTGGLSSRLGDLVGSEVRTQRRAEGADTATYSLAAVAGPAVVAAIATVGPPLAALLAVGALAVLAALVIAAIPRLGPRLADSAEAMSVGAALLFLGRHGPLRRVVLITIVSAAGLGAVTFAALVLGPELTDRPGAGATLVAVWGFGSLVGSLLVTWRPIRGEPEVATTIHVTVVAATFALCAFAPSYPWALAAFAVSGVANAHFVAATFAARSTYAPAEARTQVFVSVAGLKVAAASAGTAMAGPLVAREDTSTVIIGAASATLAVALLAVVDRLRGIGRR